MARIVSVASMVSQVRLLGDYLVVDGDFSGDAPRAPSSGTIIGWLDWANDELYDEYTESDEDYNLTRYAFMTTVGSGTYSLPSDFYKLRAVEHSQDPTNQGYAPLGRATVDDDRYGPALGAPVAYRTIGDSLELLPTPGDVRTIRLSYVPCAQVLTDPSQTIDGLNGYDRLVVLRALCYSRAREGQPFDDFEGLFDRQWVKMSKSVKRRDRGTPMHTRDRREAGGRWPFRRTR